VGVDLDLDWGFGIGVAEKGKKAAARLPARNLFMVKQKLERLSSLRGKRHGGSQVIVAVLLLLRHPRSRPDELPIASSTIEIGRF
jgi:hypothetical protein